MVGKVFIFTGAPENDSLDWSSPGLLRHFQDPFARFARLPAPHSATPESSSNDTTALDLALWRSLPLEQVYTPTGFSQRHDMDFIGHFPNSADSLTTASISFEAASQSFNEGSQLSQRLLSECYEHSLAVFDDIPSSQLGPPSSNGNGETQDITEQESFVTNISFNSTRSADETSLASVELKDPITRRGGRTDHLSDLEDIPKASYLLSIEPQTMSVNLVCGIISIASPRTVNTKRGHTRSLIEVLVGDETKSGFSITFWLPSDSVATSVLAGLRAQDIVLMQDVALNVFMKKVFGQSLPWNMTKVHLLYRRKFDDSDIGGYYTAADLTSSKRAHPQLDKTRKVRDWILKFVGGGQGNVTGNKSKQKTGKGQQVRSWDKPPPLDSQ